MAITINGSTNAIGGLATGGLPDGSVDADTLAANAVTTAKIAADAVDGTKVADDAIDSEHYTDGSIDTAHIADNQITAPKTDLSIVQGDVIYGTGTDTWARLAKGTASQVLSMNSGATAPEWAAAAAGGMPGTPYFSFSCNDAGIGLAAQSTWYDCKPNNPSAATNGVVFDSANAWVNTTGKFTPQTAGTYFVWGGVGAWEQGGAACNRDFHIVKNGTDVVGKCQGELSENGDFPSYFTAGLIALNGSSDYVICEVYQTGHQYSGSISCFNFGALRLF